MKEIKIVLLGKTGQIGSVLGKKLKKNNFIKCLSRKDLELSNLSSIGKKLDKFTLNNLTHGRLKNVGTIHFSNQRHLKDLTIKLLHL